MTSSSFFWRFLRKPTQIGALCPSSSTLCRSITDSIGLEDAASVVELGPGTGVITREIIRRIRPRTTFVAVELDASLCLSLRRRFPGLHLYNDSASHLGEILEAEHLTHADVIVSGLPWAVFPEPLQREILTGVLAALRPGGCFTTFAYLQGLMLPAGRRFRRQLHDLFDTTDTLPIIWRNLPPSLIYRCHTVAPK